jgi:uncharacterized protein YgbK (DUF1537 family)
VLAIDVDKVMDGSLQPESLVSFLLSNRGRAPLAYSTLPPDLVATLQRKYGKEEIAYKLDEVFAATAKALFMSGVRRIVVGGGETSGAVVSALGVTSFRIGPEIDPGVPVLVAENKKELGMALKSGNFGTPNFFEKALAAIAGGKG